MISFRTGQRILPKPGEEIAPGRTLPPVLTQIKNVSAAAMRAGNALATGRFPVATKEAAAQRKAICETCEFFRPQDERCSHPKCGCFTQVKVWFASEHCPAAPPKW
jgi:hypothetical protein